MMGQMGVGPPLADATYPCSEGSESPPLASSPQSRMLQGVRGSLLFEELRVLSAVLQTQLDPIHRLRRKVVQALNRWSNDPRVRPSQNAAEPGNEAFPVFTRSVSFLHCSQQQHFQTKARQVCLHPEVQNTRFCPLLQENSHTVVLQGVRNIIYGAP